MKDSRLAWTMPDRTRCAAILMVFLLANLLFLFWFGALDAYEGDDINSVVPMIHLAEAKQGFLLIYRYAWQPLSYEIGAGLLRLTGSTDAVFRMAAVAGAISLTLLLWQGWAERPTRRGWIAALALLLTIPEYWYSGLYYNSSILALPFLAGAILVVRGGGGAMALFAAGLLAGTAALMRLDFILACPLLAALAWTRTGRIAPVLVLAGGVLTALAIAFAAGIVDPVAILDVYRTSSAEIARKAADPGWDMRAKLFTWSVMFTPIGWLILLCGGGLALWRSGRSTRIRAGLYLLAAVPLMFPLKDMLSVKYALPLLAFAPMILMHCLAAIEEAVPKNWGQKLPAATLAGGILLMVLSVSLIGRPPFIVPGLMPARTVGTHDGARSYGGYFWMMAAMAGDSGQGPDRLAAVKIAEQFLGGDASDILILGGENYFDRGGMGWRHLQLVLEKAGVRGAVAGPHRIVFSKGAHRLWLIGPGAVVPIMGPDARIIDLRDGA